jgi:hypothetical protein
MRYHLLGAATAAASLITCGLALADPPPAQSDTTIVPQGVVGGDYSYLGFNQGLGHANVYGGELGGIVPFGSEFSGQVTGGYHRIDASGFGANDWNVAGTVSWDTNMGRLGANVGYTNDNLLGGNANVTNYGVYGEYYAGDEFTLGVRGGGATASANAFGSGSGSSTGGYAGGEAIGYFMPDLAVRGTVGYLGISGGHQWTAGVHGEYLFSQVTPISGWVGYDYSTLGSGGSSIAANTVSVGLKYYFGGSGSLQHHQRTGQDDWGPAALDLVR